MSYLLLGILGLLLVSAHVEEWDYGKHGSDWNFSNCNNNYMYSSGRSISTVPLVDDLLTIRIATLSLLRSSPLLELINRLSLFMASTLLYTPSKVCTSATVTINFSTLPHMVLLISINLLTLAIIINIFIITIINAVYSRFHIKKHIRSSKFGFQSAFSF